MKNPWTKKNPLMSIWLSGANAVAGSARGHATAAGKRQSATLMSQGAKQLANLWTGGLAAAPSRKKRRR